MSKEKKSRVSGSPLRYLFLIATLISIALALIGGLYSIYLEPSPSIYTHLGVIALIMVGVLMKSFFDHLIVKRKEKKEEIKVLKNLLMECEGNLELIRNKKIQWPQVHFSIISYNIVKEKEMLSGFSSKLHKQIEASYQLVSEIEKRKFRAFDQKTDMMLEKLAQILSEVIEELK